MSYIDTFDHELVAFFAGLPLYHPLERVEASADRADEFACSPAELVLGGGDGEHPAIVLREPGAAALHFLSAALPDQADIPAAEQALLDDAPPADACVEFAGWSLEDIASFVERCRSAAFVTPYQPGPPFRHGPLEEWLVCNLGEFVYFAMPELATDILAQLLVVGELIRKPMFLNALILPPGYGSPAGRYVNLQGHVVWGNYRWVTTRR